MAERIDLTGCTFGFLTVVSRSDRPETISNTRAQWLCVCKCGNTLRVKGASLRHGPTKSCGCRRIEMIRRLKVKHGQAGRTREYASWSSMLTRCRNQRSTKYPEYGGRGISVCERWHDFRLFFQDMGTRPEGTSLDRINVNGNYEASNCRWATPAEQSSNRRKTARLDQFSTGELLIELHKRKAMFE